MEEILQNKYPCRNEKDCIYRVIDNEAVVFSEEGQWIHELNSIGVDIWKMCDGTLNFQEIVDKICNEYEIEREVAEADIQSFIEGLSKKNLIILKSTRSMKSKPEIRSS